MKTLTLGIILFCMPALAQFSGNSGVYDGNGNPVTSTLFGSQRALDLNIVSFASTTGSTVSKSTNASFYPLFVASSSDSSQPFNLGTGLTFNPSTNTLTTTTFVGALTGTASGNTAYTASNHGVVLSGSGNTMTVLAPSSSTTKVLTSGGSSADPSWQDASGGISFPSTGNTFTTGAGAASPGSNFNTAVGLNALGGISGGSGLNTIIGVNALKNAASPSQDVSIGVNSCGGLTGSEQNNVCLGYGSDIASGVSNSFAMGANAIVNQSNSVAFGPALKTEIGAAESGSPTAWLSLPASTTSAHTAPIKIQPGTLMTSTENGAIETNGTHIYWTDSGGTRHQLDN